MAPSGLEAAVSRLAAGAVLADDEVVGAMDDILKGDAEPVLIAGFLMGLQSRGPTPAEIAAAARAVRARALTIAAPDDVVDTCGTGGDGADTINISTAAALVAAAAGAPVAKHGNRAVSSRSGSSDVLAALGLDLAAPIERAERALAEAGCAFLFAPNHHPAMRHAAAARAALGVRTLFNLVGPLANPAGARRQLLGVYDARLLRPMAEALRDLGSERAWVVCGSDGLDELTTTGPSSVAALENGEIRTFETTPEAAGLARARPGALAGGGPEENAEAIRGILGGERGPRRDVVVLNAAAAIVVGGRAGDLAEAARAAEAAIDGGQAEATLQKMLKIYSEQ